MTSFKGKAIFGAVLIATSGSSFAARWTAIDAGLPSTSFAVRALAVDPAKPSTLYALTSTEIVSKSTDAGGSWGSSNTITGVYFLTIHPTQSTLYAITRRGVFKSVDGGESWKTAGAGLTSDASSLAISASDPLTLYAVTFNG